MIRRTFRPWLLGAAAISLAAAPVLAHHSFAMYDLTKRTTLKGEVKVFKFTNPHTWIFLDVVEDGKPVSYALEGQQVRLMTKAGFKRSSLKPGDKVSIVINPLRDGSKGGHFLQVMLPDGKVLGGSWLAPGAAGT
jgi:Family of unknown function (DUF6152)